ncbi:Nucleoside 2-deoxyribosyltransferase [Symmachiella dynata]|uniref:nucleoside 2-deoxyribosyltransferase n=1 Tax=Symmachiella dynata TaxID=2527995 RepID=UPI0011885BD7|nr:nucleoside 2-deoxyribosyltransferase [Symmachiella dynata]QDT47384.1 Nucleoside 2-deoxyribosyltransferase [Symmachiella dynata]
MIDSRRTGQHRVYCAGPLFNQAERDEMTAIADCLCDFGCEVYLPHRDGMEFRFIHAELIDRGWAAPQAAQFLHAAIFALDVYQLVEECDCMVWNLNGRTPDEGAVSEAAMAWTLGKPLVAFKEDVRTLIAGRDNPLLVGMVDFQTVDTIAKIPSGLSRAIQNAESKPLSLEHISKPMQRAVGQGSLLWSAMQEASAQGNDSVLADIVSELFAPQEGSV